MTDERKSCFPTLEEFKAAFLITPQNQLLANSLTASASAATTSSYFRLTTVVTIGTTQFTLYSLLSKQAGTVRTLLRSQTAD